MVGNSENVPMKLGIQIVVILLEFVVNYVKKFPILTSRISNFKKSNGNRFEMKKPSQFRATTDSLICTIYFSITSQLDHHGMQLHTSSKLQILHKLGLSSLKSSSTFVTSLIFHWSFSLCHLHFCHFKLIFSTFLQHFSDILMIFVTFRCFFVIFLRFSLTLWWFLLFFYEFLLLSWIVFNLFRWFLLFSDNFYNFLLIFSIFRWSLLHKSTLSKVFMSLNVFFNKNTECFQFIPT